MTGTALFVGDVSLDLTMHVPRLPEPDEKLLASYVSEAPGGVVANAAIAAARAGARARLVLRLGDDIASAMVRRQLAEAGLTLDANVAAGPLCRVVILVDDSGEKRLVLHPGVSMYPEPVQIAALDLHRVTWAHTAAYDPIAAARLAARCREAGLPWSVDLEPASFPDGILALADTLNGAAVAFCNLRAAARLGDDAAGLLHRLGVGAVITTLGPDGAAWHEPGQPPRHVAAPTIIPRDTTGAGDCLAGWFIAETLRGAAPLAALRRAVAAASWSCGRSGAQASFPDLTQIPPDPA